jgi:hypothetical protein
MLSRERRLEQQGEMFPLDGESGLDIFIKIDKLPA